MAGCIIFASRMSIAIIVISVIMGCRFVLGSMGPYLSVGDRVHRITVQICNTLLDIYPI